MGKGVTDADDPHTLFTAGLRAQDYPKGFMGKADLVVCVGYDLVEWAPSNWNPRRDRRIICIDTVAAEVDEHYVPDVELTGGIGTILTHLGNLVSARPPARLAAPPYRELFQLALDQGSDDGFPVKPQRVLRDLREIMAPDDVLISDVGAHKLWVSRLWPAHQPNTVLISNGAAAMGFAVPAAIAARLVLPKERHVVTISGDGGFLMNVQELETATPARPRDREPRLDGQRVRGHRAAPDAQVRAAGGYQVHEPRPGGAGGVVRHRRPAGWSRPTISSRRSGGRSSSTRPASSRSPSTIAKTCGSPSGSETSARLRKEWPRHGDDDGVGSARSWSAASGTRRARRSTSPRRSTAAWSRRWHTAAGPTRERAVDAAAKAMETPLPAHERAAVLDRVAALLRERREDLARTISQEAGKPIATAQVEADRAVQTILFSAHEARGLGGELIGMDAHPAGVNHAGMVMRRPIGVVGAISPFNFPLNLVAHKIGPAFAAGCACVLKPATATPLSALALAQAFADAGQPAGWLNVIVGQVERDRRRPDRGRAGQADHVHRAPRTWAGSCGPGRRARR